MPARSDPNEDAAALLERRRAQNRLAQQRFRQKKLALATSNVQQQPEVAAVQEKQASPNDEAQSTDKASNGPTTLTDATSSLANLSWSSSSDSSPSSASPSDCASDSSSTMSLSPSGDHVQVSPTFAPPPASMPMGATHGGSSTGSGISVPFSPWSSSMMAGFDFGDLLSSPSASSSSSSAPITMPSQAWTGVPAYGQSTAMSSSSDNTHNTPDEVPLIGSSAAMPIDDEIAYLNTLLREERDDERQQQQQQSQMFGPSPPQQLQSQPQSQQLQWSADPNSSFADVQHFLDNLIADSSNSAALTAPTSLPSMPNHSGCPFGSEAGAWKVINLLTHERGILGAVLLKTGSPNVAALRQSLNLGRNIERPVAMAHFSFAKAFFHNATVLGFLDDDLRMCAQTSNIHQVWPQRGAPFTDASTSALRQGQMSDGIVPAQTLAKNQTTIMSQKVPFPIPTALSHQDELRRIERLQEWPNMYPTALQLTIPHSIIIDTLPWPSVRDGLIRLASSGQLDNATIKGDLLGKPFDCMGEGNVFQIHGDDPCDPEAWELSEYWVSKYSGLLNLDRSILRRTNWWRRMEGKPPIGLEDQGVREMARLIADRSAWAATA